MPFQSFQAELQVGDRVEFIDSNGSGDYRSVQGDKGIIREIDSGGLAMCDMEGAQGSYTIGVMQRRLKKIPSLIQITLNPLPARTISVPRDPGKARTFVIGDRVRMISRSPEHGRGEVNVGDIGTIIEVNTGSTIDCRIDFSYAHRRWAGSFNDIEHEFAEEVVEVAIPEVSLDEAVKLCKAIEDQIKELQAQAAGYKHIMQANGIKFI